MVMKAFVENRALGQVYCPMCTHTVPAEIELRAKRAKVAAGQRCPRCQSSLEVAVIVQILKAA
jgi:transposase-like protein